MFITRKMKNTALILFFLFFSLVSLATSFANSLNEKKNPTPIFKIDKGINISEWMERENATFVYLDTFFTHSKIDLLCSLGFDHLRIPVTEKNLFDQNLNYKENEFDLLRDRIDYALAKGLKIIFDLHGSRVHSFLNEKNPLFSDSLSEEHFLKVWGMLQARLSMYSVDSLAYECLNEPAAPINNHELWNRLVSKWISLIRQKENKRYLVIGSNRGNQLWTFKYLKIPQDEKRIILSLHFYQPSVLTHYKASWTELKYYEGPVDYPGQTIPDSSFRQLADSLKEKMKYSLTIYDKETIRKELLQVVNMSRIWGFSLNVGEFGCRRNVPNKDARYRWFTDLVALFNEYGISYTVWGMNGSGFGIWDYDQSLDSSMIRILMNK